MVDGWCINNTYYLVGNFYSSIPVYGLNSCAKMMPVATAAFNDSASPLLGMVIFFVALDSTDA